MVNMSPFKKSAADKSVSSEHPKQIYLNCSFYTHFDNKKLFPKCRRTKDKQKIFWNACFHQNVYQIFDLHKLYGNIKKEFRIISDVVGSI